MNCLHCNAENQDGAKFCQNCGKAMNYTLSYKDANSRSSDILLFIYLFQIFVNDIVAQTVIQELDDNWYESPTKYIIGSLWIVSNLCLILLPLAIKHKTIKIVGLILTSLIMIYCIQKNIEIIMN